MSSSHDQPANRPFVSLNAAATADGKIALADRRKISIGSPEDRAQMEALRATADAVMIGGGTLISEDPPLLILDPATRASRAASKGAPHPRNVAVCSSLPDRLAEMSFFLHPETERIVFTTVRTPPCTLALAEKYAHVEIVSVDAVGRVDLTEVVRRLVQLRICHLLLEGGGELNFSMINAGFVDEVYLTICPFVFGGRSAPTAIDGIGFESDRICKLDLKSHRISAHGEVFLHYTVLPEPATVSPSPRFPNGLEIR